MSIAQLLDDMHAALRAAGHTVWPPPRLPHQQPTILVLPKPGRPGRPRKRTMRVVLVLKPRRKRQEPKP